jgi:hypothetical protein
VASINGEISLDVMDRNDYGISQKPDERYLGLALVPLIRKQLRRAVLVFGPTVGYFRYTLWRRYTPESYRSVTKEITKGFSLGFNVGVFLPMGRIALGGMLNGRFQICTGYQYSWDNQSSPGENCSSEKRAAGTAGTFGLAGAVMF